MDPLAHSDRHDTPWLIDEPIPSMTAVVDDVVVGFEDAVRQPVIAHQLPDVFDWIESLGQRGGSGISGRREIARGRIASGTHAKPPIRGFAYVYDQILPHPLNGQHSIQL